MDVDGVIARLEAVGAVEDEGEWVSLTEEFEDRVVGLRGFVNRATADEVVARLQESFDDLPTEELREAVRQHDEWTVARYISVRESTGLGDEDAMLAAEVIRELEQTYWMQCPDCGHDAPGDDNVWDVVENEGVLTTTCTLCGGTEVVSTTPHWEYD